MPGRSGPPVIYDHLKMKSWRHYIFFLGGTLVAVIGTAQFLHKLNLRTSFILTLGSVFIFVLFGMIACRDNKKIKRIFENRAQRVLFLGLLLLGVCARTFCWHIFPPSDGQFLEEAQTGGIAYFAAQHSQIDSHYPVVNLLADVGLRVFGHTMTGLRVPFVLWGIVSIPFFYIAARLIYRSFAAAFFATALFASCSFLAGSSRIAMETMSPITSLTMALAAVFYAHSRKDYWAFGLAGFSIGILLLEYIGFKIIAVLLFFFLVLSCSCWQERGESLRSAPSGGSCSRLPYRHFIVLLSCVGIILLPFILSGFPNLKDMFFENINRNQEAVFLKLAKKGGDVVLKDQIAQVGTILSFVFIRGEGNDVLPGRQGLIEFFTGILGALGGVYYFLFSRNRALKMLLVGGCLVIVAGAALMVTNPSRYRLIPMIPLYFLLIGAGVDDAWMLMRRKKGVAIFVFAVVLAVLVGRNLFDFFGVAIKDRSVQESFCDVNVILSQTIATVQARDKGTEAYLLTNLDHLAKVSDYGFLYDWRRVHVVKEWGDISGKSGYLVAHDKFIPGKEEMPLLKGCARWKTKFGRNEILFCPLP